MQVEHFSLGIMAVKYKLAKREEVCANGLQSRIGMYGFRELFRVLGVYRSEAKIFSGVRTIFRMLLLFLQLAVTISTPQRCVEIC